ncbi:MAG TPA: CaiB/BaiF CoA-transferase family protein [Natronosporangium sp.]|nr:CaiB/BaiF CoA-transferase family protein [Natronosporangium sp.]
MTTAGDDGPLAGVSVVAVEQAISMPFCTFILAELGADVIKIERPGAGDVVRGWDDVVRGLSSGYVWVNANKRALTVDLRQESGQRIVQRLAAQADVFVENFAPGVGDRLGIGAGTLRRHNPRLIYCSLSGYGQDGPFRDVKAYDLLVQGESGILLTNGYPEAPAKVGLPITDLIAGATAAIGILAALVERARTGRGTYLDVAMLDSTAPWLGYFPHRYWHRGEEPPRTGMRHQYICPYGPYRCADGAYVNLVVASDAHWRAFCERVVEQPAWLDDPRFATMESRRRHRDLVEAAVEEVIASRPSGEWLSRLDRAGLPYGRVRTMASVVEHPQLRHRHAFVQADSPVGPVPVARFPLSSPHRRRQVPGLGQHTDQILSELGFSAEEIERLRERRVV